MTGTVAVILAGGQARRMGGVDKCRLLVGGQTVIARTLACLAPQVDALALSANGDAMRFADLGLSVLADGVAGESGPLAGVLAGLDWAAGMGADWVLSVPGDSPFLPGDLVARLHAARIAAGVDFACAGSGGRAHPVVAVWPVSCRAEMRAALAAGRRRVGAFAVQAMAAWEGVPDPFVNLNTPEDLRRANV